MLSILLLLLNLHSQETKLTGNDIRQPFIINASSSSQYVIAIDTNNNVNDGFVVSISSNGVFSSNQPYFFATKTTDQSVGTNDTKITWNNIIEDNFSGWDSSNNRYVIKVSGIYNIHISGIIFQAGSGTVADVFVSIYKNGSKLVETPVSKQLGYGGLSNTINITLKLNTNDYLEIFARTNSGSPVFRGVFNWLTIIKIN